MPVDSLEGIEIMMASARRSGLVLSEYHKRIAMKHGVSTEGVTFARPIPGQPDHRPNGWERQGL